MLLYPHVSRCFRQKISHVFLIKQQHHANVLDRPLVKSKKVTTSTCTVNSTKKLQAEWIPWSYTTFIHRNPQFFFSCRVSLHNPKSWYAKAAWSTFFAPSLQQLRAVGKRSRLGTSAQQNDIVKKPTCFGCGKSLPDSLSITYNVTKQTHVESTWLPLKQCSVINSDFIFHYIKPTYWHILAIFNFSTGFAFWTPS